MAKDLGFSLGKLNYCLKSLQEKGFVKIKTFQNKKRNIFIFNTSLHQKALQREQD